MRSALVMGGTGNIGAAVTRRLLLDGYDVTVLTRTPPAENPHGVRILIADRDDDAQLGSVLRNNRFEYVVDLVCHCEAHAQQDISAVTIYLPTDAAEGIYNNVYYTTDLRNIVNEVNIQRTTAVNILNNREKYEAIVTECDNIFHTIEGMLTPQQQPSQAYKQEEFEAFKIEVAEKVSMQQDILMKIASELGLNKNKDGKQKG